MIQSKISVLGANEYQCEDCLHVCKTRQNISVHIEAIHISHPPVVCSICQKTCSTRDALRKHLLRYHRETGPIVRSPFTTA